MTAARALAIRTPEGVTFELPLAGPFARFLAWLVDLACLSVALSAVGGVLQAVGFLSLDLAAALLVLAYFALGVGYAILTEALWHGQTVGKRLLGLRVIDEQGLRLTFRQVVVRNLLRAIDALPAFYLVGGLALVFGRHAQRLGDLAAGTVVIRETRPPPPPADALLADKHNSLRSSRHLAARIRQRLAPAEASLLLRALARRAELDPDARLRLFAALASHLRARLDLPEELIEPLPDEQLVRSIADVVFRPDGRG